nr:GNAT family N-acetyltransferase [Micromonospora provocatoris]
MIRSPPRPTWFACGASRTPAVWSSWPSPRTVAARAAAVRQRRSGAVSEVAGIAVRAPCRRRGLASAITADVTRRLFEAGAEVAWLEAGGEDSWRVYERVGYRPGGQRLYIAMD